jgi:assimilatory nitrate reductase catalytic subunit
MEPTRPYAAIARTKTGWRAEIAGVKRPLNWEEEARTVLNLSDGSASVFEDAARGLARVAIVQDGRISGLFFASPDPVALSRSHAVALLGTDCDALPALAGVPGEDRPDPGATVCACFDIGVNDIRRAIDAGHRSVPALGACLSAGTNCGSCKPEIQALLDAVPPVKLAAE